MYQKSRNNRSIVRFCGGFRKGAGARLNALATLISFSIALVGSRSALASGAACNGVATFFDWGCSGSDGESIILGLLSTFLNWMAVGVSIAVLIGLVVGAVMYASAGGNEAQAKKAMEYIRNAIIALVLYFIMYASLQYLIPGGIF